MRVSKDYDSADVPTLATKLETSLRRRIVNIIVRQKDNDLESTFLDCVAQEKTDKMLKRLKERGFAEGPDKSPDIWLREGEKVTTTLRGNIKLQENSPELSFYFHQYVNNARRQVYITEVDKFAQHGLDNFRGHVQFSSERLAAEREGDGLLCELAVSLPKV